MGSRPIYHHAATSLLEARDNRPLILSVDDDLQLLHNRFTVLSAGGYAELSASDAAPALDLFGNWQPDLVVLDYGLPNANGGVVAEAIKVHSPHVPIIMISDHSGYPGVYFRLADICLSNPVNTEQLLEAIRKLLPLAQRTAPAERQLRSDINPPISVVRPGEVRPWRTLTCKLYSAV